jgi:DNA helicase-2/ATP-dependent DNA helicase PcrA
VIDAKLEEARRLFFVGITRVKADKKYPGTLFLTYPKEMGLNTAKGLSIPFTNVINGKAQLTPSRFINELGKDAPAPVFGML